MPVLICVSIPLISFVVINIIYILIVNGTEIPEKVIFIIAIGFMSINVMVFVLYEFINIESEKSYNLINQNKQYKLIEQHNTQVMNIYDKMREWRHDYNHHLQLVLGMLEQIDVDKNKKPINYIKNLNSNIKSSSLDIVTGNHIVDAAVSAKETLASSHFIKFEHNILLPDNINIESTDLCSIISNLLDNAIEACVKLEHDRYINIEMLIFKNQFNIKITNSTNGEYKLENGKFKTTKLGDLHGIGISHVKSIVEAYGGIYDIKSKPKCFTTHISIPLTRKT
jgi:Signal transduction histidine kinase regulating citrate/malate metabolism